MLLKCHQERYLKHVLLTFTYFNFISFFGLALSNICNANKSTSFMNFHVPKETLSRLWSLNN